MKQLLIIFVFFLLFSCHGKNENQSYENNNLNIKLEQLTKNESDVYKNNSKLKENDYILEKEIELKTFPGGNIFIRLNKGDIVRIIGLSKENVNNSTWINIAYKNTIQGWIKSDEINIANEYLPSELVLVKEINKNENTANLLVCYKKNNII